VSDGGGDSGFREQLTKTSCGPVRGQDGGERALAVTGPLAAEKVPEPPNHSQQHCIQNAKERCKYCGSDRELDGNFSGQVDFHRPCLLLALRAGLIENPLMCLIDENLGFAKLRDSRSHMGGKPDPVFSGSSNLKKIQKNFFVFCDSYSVNPSGIRTHHGLVILNIRKNKNIFFANIILHMCHSLVSFVLDHVWCKSKLMWDRIPTEPNSVMSLLVKMVTLKNKRL
jgi:hypothetical protein